MPDALARRMRRYAARKRTGNKANLEHWNLLPCCQRCHLRVQARVTWWQDWPFPHSPWAAKRVADCNEWCARRGLPLLSLNGVEARSYENEWPDSERPTQPLEAAALPASASKE